MKFPSVTLLAQTAVNVAKRFPFEILSALTGTVAAIFVVELESTNRESENVFIRLIMAAEISLLLSFAATLFAEEKKLNTFKKLMLRLSAIFLAVILFFLINPGERQSDYVRFFLLALSFHLLVAFAAFNSKNRVHAFWQFNKTLFLRILTSALYSAVLFLGISAAIGAMNFLFGFKFEWDTFFILWLCIVGLFNTMFFLAGVPQNMEALEQDFSYPKGLKLFTQYVLVPLSSIYVLILLAYEIKILLAWKLPKGLVSNLILSYAVFGILSLLLVYPIRNQDENKWLKTYSRYFYFLLIPLLLLLFVAVGTRVLKYGVTENRYFLIVLALWLLFITVYFLISKKQNIKLIPISLFVVTLFSVYGPQSAYSVAETSQRQILIGVFKKYNAVFNGKLLRLPEKVSAKDGNRASAALTYLIKNHDFAAVQPLFSRNLESVNDSIGKLKSKENHLKLSNLETKAEKLDWAKESLGLGKFYGDYYNPEVGPVKPPKAIDISAKSGNLINVQGYKYLVDINSYVDSSAIDTADKQQNPAPYQGVNEKTYHFKLNKQYVEFDPHEVTRPLLKPGFKLENYLAKGTGSQYYVYYTLPASYLTLKKTLAGHEVEFRLSHIVLTKRDNTTVQITNIQGYFLVK